MDTTNLSHRYAFAKFQQSLRRDADTESPSHTIPTFLALYIFGFLYQLLLVYDTLRLKNTIQVIGLGLYNVGLLIYAAVQMNQIQDAVTLLDKKKDIDSSVWHTVRPYLIAIPCIIALATILMAVIAWKLYDEFAWTIYKHISADLRMKRRYLTFQVSSRNVWRNGDGPDGDRSISPFSSSISSSSSALRSNLSSWLSNMTISNSILPSQLSLSQ